MAREVNPRPQPVETMRAADADRHQIADHLKAALDEGRLTLGEYDDRVRQAYAARTYAELMVLVTDLPAPGLSASEVQAKQDAERRREARRLPTAVAVLWTIWAALAAISLVVWVVVGATAGFENLYFWPAWMAVPGVALGAVTIGVQNIRSQQRGR